MFLPFLALSKKLFSVLLFFCFNKWLLVLNPSAYDEVSKRFHRQL